MARPCGVDRRLRVGISRNASTNRRYFDNALGRVGCSVTFAGMPACLAVRASQAGRHLDNLERRGGSGLRGEIAARVRAGRNIQRPCAQRRARRHLRRLASLTVRSARPVGVLAAVGERLREWSEQSRARALTGVRRSCGGEAVLRSRARALVVEQLRPPLLLLRGQAV